MLQKSIHHVAIQILERDMFALKPSTEIGDHHDLVSDRVSRIALLGYSGSVSVKVHAQRPLPEPFNRFWESEKLVYHSPRMPTTMPILCLVNFCQSLAGSGRHAVRRHSPGCCIVTKSVWVSLLHASSAAMVSKQRAQSGRSHTGATSGAFERDKQSVRRSLRPFEPQIVVKKFRCLRGQRQDIGLFSHAARPALPFP